MAGAVQTLKSLKPRDVASMTDKELNRLLRESAGVVNKRLKGFQKAGLDPAKAIASLPKSMASGVSVSGTRAQKLKTLATLQRIVREETSTVSGYRKTLLRAAREFEKTHPRAKKVSAKNISPETIKEAHGRTKIVYDQYGNPVEVEYGVKGLSKKEIGDYWDAFHRARDAAGVPAGSQSSPKILDDFYDVWLEGGTEEEIHTKVMGRIQTQYEEEESKRLRETSFFPENEPRKIF